MKKSFSLVIRFTKKCIKFNVELQNQMKTKLHSKFMKKFIFTIVALLSTYYVNAQILQPIWTKDWNSLNKSGFYNCNIDGAINYPNYPSKKHPNFWGINTAYGRDETYNGQIAFGMTSNSQILPPQVWVRTTSISGEGLWAKLIHDKGDQIIEGSLRVDKLTSISHIFVGEDIKNQLGEGARLYFQGVDENTDPMYISKYNREYNKTDLRINIGDNNSGEDRLTIGNEIYPEGIWKTFFTILDNGKVGIGTETPKNSLDVKGTIRAEKVTIEAPGWSDFVFDKNYKLPTLESVEQHISDYKHLPGIPSEKEVMEEGVNIGEMQSKLLQKIEELTLYTIQQQKQIEILRSEINELKK